jgi:hypothetical protein
MTTYLLTLTEIRFYNREDSDEPIATSTTRAVLVADGTADAVRAELNRMCEFHGLECDDTDAASGQVLLARKGMVCDLTVSRDGQSDFTGQEFATLVP